VTRGNAKERGLEGSEMAGRKPAAIGSVIGQIGIITVITGSRE
jgi:hypothetical protein